jgi:type I restriction enzyme, R subunit
MSTAEFIARLFGELPALFKDEDELRALWNQPDTSKTLLDSLAEKDYGPEQLREIERLIDAEKSDLYDVLAYITFALAPITRQERVDASRPFITARYDAKLQAFLDFVLSQYISEGVGELDQAKLPHLLELRYRAVSDAALEFSGVTKIRKAFVGFQAHLYAQRMRPRQMPPLRVGAALPDPPFEFMTDADFDITCYASYSFTTRPRMATGPLHGCRLQRHLDWWRGSIG